MWKIWELERDICGKISEQGQKVQGPLRREVCNANARPELRRLYLRNKGRDLIGAPQVVACHLAVHETNTDAICTQKLSHTPHSLLSLLFAVTSEFTPRRACFLDRGPSACHHITREVSNNPSDINSLTNALGHCIDNLCVDVRGADSPSARLVTSSDRERFWQAGMRCANTVMKGFLITRVSRHCRG